MSPNLMMVNNHVVVNLLLPLIHRNYELVDDESPFSPSLHQSDTHTHSYLVQVIFLSSIITSVIETLYSAVL